MSYASTIAARASLVEHWRMGESSGNITGVNSTVGTAAGSPTYSATGLVTGDADTAITFDGTDDKFTLPSDTVLDFQLNQPFSVEAIIKPNFTRSGSTTESRDVISKLGTNLRGWACVVGYAFSGNRTLPEFYLIDTWPTKYMLIRSVLSPDLDLANGTPCHILWTYDGSGTIGGMRILINGVEYPYTTSSAGTVATIDSSVAASIGGRSNNTAWFKGTLDEVAVYDEELTPYEANESLAAMKGTAIDTSSLSVPTKMLLLWDADSDVDDCTALSLLHGLDDLNETSIIAICSGSSDPDVAELADAINTFHLRPDIPIGKSGTADPISTRAWVAATIAQCTYDLDGTTADTSVNVARQALADSSDNSVVIYEMGYPLALSDLLNSSADGISGLTGSQLIAAKVRYVVFSAGLYTLPTANSNSAEYNFRTTASASNNVVANCPVPIYFLGYETGINLKTGTRFNAEGDPDDPTRIALDEDGLLATGREGWGSLAGLFAVRGKTHGGSPLFVCIPGGNAVNSSTGVNTWTWGTGNHFLVRPARFNSAMKTMIEALEIAAPTGDVGIEGEFDVIGAIGHVVCEGVAAELPVIDGIGYVDWDGEAGTYPVIGGMGHVEIA